MPLINCEVNLFLTWSENCALTDTAATTDANPNADPPVVAINAPTNATFKIKDTNLYVPVVTLSAENDNKLLEQLKTGFERTVAWNKCRSEMSNQARNNNLNYFIDSTFTNVNRLFVLSFKNEHGNDGRNESVRSSFKKYYVPKVEVKDFNVLIDGKQFFEIPVKNKEESYEAINEMSKNNDYTTGNLLDYEYFSKHCKLIAINLGKQIELENPDLKQQMQQCSLSLRKKNKLLLIFHKICNCCLMCIKMETQKIVNLLNGSDKESSKFATIKWYIINDQIMDNMVKEMKMIQLLNLKQQSLNQIFVPIQMYIFL